jgi:UDP-3-O-[3-hydroxymyristoyl] glucosamine N-acyltransferase
MKFEESKTLKEIADFLGCEFEGSESHLIHGVNEIHRVSNGDIVFVDHPKYYDKALNSAATTILIDKRVACPDGKALLISKNPFNDFNTLTKHYRPYSHWTKAISDSAVIGENTMIHPNVSIGHHVTIGDNCIIHAGVVLMDRCQIGNNVIIQSNTTIGTSAFYYQKKDSTYNRLHTCGSVIIEDFVEIGALCSIDAGVTATTVIGAGSKLDNQVHIGHDTRIGKNCLFAAQVGVAGCVEIEDNVTLWGQVGVPANRKIGEGVTVLGQSGVLKDLESGKTYFGSPADEARIKYRELALLKKLPTIIENL